MNSALKNCLLIPVFAVAFFSCSQTEKRFLSDEVHEQNLIKLQKLNANMRAQLAQFGANENSALNLNIFFATDDSIKAKNLADTLEQIGYRTNRIHRSPKDKTLWVLAGTSGRVSMDSVALDNWAALVCNLGYRYDCEFEGWSPITE